MLVLSRRQGEMIDIGENIVVKIVSVQGGKVRVGIEAPNGVPVMRRELLERAPALRPVPALVAFLHSKQLTDGCTYDACVANAEQTCHRWMTGECAGPKGQSDGT
jgi:carbon storage regulator